MNRPRNSSRPTLADIKREVAARGSDEVRGEPIVEENPSPVATETWVDAAGVQWRRRGPLLAKRLRHLMADPTVPVIVWRRPWGKLDEVPPTERDALYNQVKESMALDEGPWCGYTPWELKNDETHRSSVVIEA